MSSEITTACWARPLQCPWVGETYHLFWEAGDYFHLEVNQFTCLCDGLIGLGSHNQLDDSDLGTTRCLWVWWYNTTKLIELAPSSSA